MDAINKFLADVDAYRADRERVGRPLTEKTVSQYLFKNSRRIGQLREGVDISYLKLTAAHRALQSFHIELSEELSQRP